MSDFSKDQEIHKLLIKKTQELEEDYPKVKNFKNFSIRLNPKSYIMPFIRDLSELFKKQFLLDEIYFSRSDQLASLSKFIHPPKSYNEIINSLKELLSEEDIGALLVASNICEKENLGYGEDKEAKKELRKVFFQRGIVLYNWLRSEETFREDILPLLKTKDHHSSPEDFKHFFKEMFETLLNFHPMRIFVSTDMTRIDLKSEIERRVCFHNSDKVVIYSRSGRNAIAEEVVKSKEIYFFEKKFEVKKKIYKLGTSRAIKFTLIHRGEKKPNKKRFLRKLKPLSQRERTKLIGEKRRRFQLEEERIQMDKILSLFKK